jgi:hypothetical protein
VPGIVAILVGLHKIQVFPWKLINWTLAYRIDMGIFVYIFML